MIKINTSDALVAVAALVEKNDLTAANRILTIVSREMSRQKKQNKSTREIEIKEQLEIRYLETFVRVKSGF